MRLENRVKATVTFFWLTEREPRLFEPYAIDTDMPNRTRLPAPCSIRCPSPGRRSIPSRTDESCPFSLLRMFRLGTESRILPLSCSLLIRPPKRNRKRTKLNTLTLSYTFECLDTRTQCTFGQRQLSHNYRASVLHVGGDNEAIYLAVCQPLGTAFGAHWEFHICWNWTVVFSSGPVRTA